METRPKLERLIRVLRERATKPGDSVRDQREKLEHATGRMASAAGVVVERDESGICPVEWLTPPGVLPRRTIVYLHGGGYTIGSLSTIRPMATHLAVGCRARVVTVGYRLAPEHRFPAPVEDSLSVYRSILERGCKPVDVMFAGDSAGGGLAISTLVASRERGLPMPAAVICFSPWADLTLNAMSLLKNQHSDPLIQRWLLNEMAEHYLGGQPRTAPLASPVYADLSNLPPLLIQAGSVEGLIDDAVRLARVAERAGVDVTLDVWDDMFHVWHAFVPELPEAVAGMRAAAEWMEHHWPQFGAPRAIELNVASFDQFGDPT